VNANEAWDVVVVGAGVIGLACAYEEARAGKSVLVLEREHAGAGAAGVAAGMLAPAAEADTGEPALIDLALESCNLYPDWVKRIEHDSGLPCRYRTEGSLLVALHQDHLVELRRLAAFQQKLGLAVDWLEGEEILEREPQLSPRVVGGMYIAGDRQIDPRSLVRSLVVAIQRHGGVVLEGVTEIELNAAGGALAGLGFIHGDSPHSISTSVAIVAAGALAQPFWRTTWGRLPLRPVKGQILRLRGATVLQHVVRSPDVYLVPREDGELVVGATAEEQGFDRRVTAGGVLDLLRDAWRLLPAIYELELAETSVGFRPALRDFLPAIGLTPTPGLFFATGHYRHGVLLAPVTATLLHESIESGKVPDRLEPFSPLRLLEGAAVGRSQ
jgi:glycine oxidase